MSAMGELQRPLATLCCDSASLSAPCLGKRDFSGEIQLKIPKVSVVFQEQKANTGDRVAK